MATVRNIIGEKPAVCRQQCGDGLEVSPVNDQDRIWKCPLGRYGGCPVEKSIRRHNCRERWRRLGLWRASRRITWDFLGAWVMWNNAELRHKGFMYGGWPAEWLDAVQTCAHSWVRFLQLAEIHGDEGMAIDAYLLELSPFTPKRG